MGVLFRLINLLIGRDVRFACVSGSLMDYVKWTISPKSYPRPSVEIGPDPVSRGDLVIDSTVDLPIKDQAWAALERLALGGHLLELDWPRRCQWHSQFHK